MRKSGRTPDPGKQSKRPWLRRPADRSRNSAGAKSTPAPVSRAKDADQNTSPASHPDDRAPRFVEPYQFDGNQRAVIDAALVANGLGDGNARAIFIGAIAYDLAVLQSHAATTPSPKPNSTPNPVTKQAVVPAMTVVAEAARGLAACLAALDDKQLTALGAALQAADHFDREHDHGYWNAVRNEAERIAGAAVDLASAQRDEPAASAHTDQPVRSADSSTPNAVRTDVAPGKTKSTARSLARSPDLAALTFIRSAADVYAQCFDEPPSAMAGEPFARVLTAVGKTTGVAVPTQARMLKSALLGQ